MVVHEPEPMDSTHLDSMVFKIVVQMSKASRENAGEVKSISSKLDE